jgi:hypothetical protein
MEKEKQHIIYMLLYTDPLIVVGLQQMSNSIEKKKRLEYKTKTKEKNKPKGYVKKGKFAKQSFKKKE